MERHVYDLISLSLARSGVLAVESTALEHNELLLVDGFVASNMVQTLVIRDSHGGGRQVSERADGVA